MQLLQQLHDTSHYRQGSPAEGHPQSASYTVNERQCDVSSVLSEHAASNPDDDVRLLIDDTSTMRQIFIQTAAMKETSQKLWC